MKNPTATQKRQLHRRFHPLDNSKELPAPAVAELSQRELRTHGPHAPVTQATERSGFVRLTYAVAGSLCVALGAVGIVLPGLPTTPFLLLASWCFGRSSRRLENALLRSRFFGPLIRDWRRHRAIHSSIRNLAVGTVILMVTATLVFSTLSLPVKAAITAFAGIGLAVILRLPVIKEQVAEHRTRSAGLVRRADEATQQ